MLYMPGPTGDRPTTDLTFGKKSNGHISAKHFLSLPPVHHTIVPTLRIIELIVRYPIYYGVANHKYQQHCITGDCRSQ